MESKVERGKRVALVDNNEGGHHREYLLAQVTSLRRLGCEVVVISWACRKDFEALPESVTSGLVVSQFQLHKRRYMKLMGSALGSKFWGRTYFKEVSKRLAEYENQAGSTVDLVFFSCIYDREFNYSTWWRNNTRWDWSGLYLHVRSFRMPGSKIPRSQIVPEPEQFLTGDRLKAVSVLDEESLGWLEKLTAKPALFHPDLLTNLEVKEGTEVVTKMKKAAAGRKIVLLAGHLVKTKGLSEMIAASKALKDEGFLFAFVGGVAWESVPSSDADFLKNAAANEVGNCFAWLKRTEPEVFNAVVAASDVVFACYRSFPNSSNVMGKAAAFGKPIIVSAGYLMGERCEKYDLGLTVKEGEVTEIVDAVRYLGTEAQWRKTDQVDNYLAQHSDSKLDEMFIRLLSGHPVQKHN